MQLPILSLFFTASPTPKSSQFISSAELYREFSRRRKPNGRPLLAIWRLGLALPGDKTVGDSLLAR